MGGSYRLNVLDRPLGPTAGRQRRFGSFAEYCGQNEQESSHLGQICSECKSAPKNLRVLHLKLIQNQAFRRPEEDQQTQNAYSQEGSDTNLWILSPPCKHDDERDEIGKK